MGNSNLNPLDYFYVSLYFLALKLFYGMLPKMFKATGVTGL